MGQLLTFPNQNRSYQGYFAPAEAPGNGVIVIQEWWGLVGHITSVADRFAAAGFPALAPDFYDGKQTDEPDEAGSLMMALDIENAAHVIESAVTALLNQPGVTGKVGVVGFCMGGQLSLFAASLDPRIGACVDFYGIHPNVKPDLAQLHAPVLGHFAESDPYADADSVRALSEALSAHGKAHEFHTYPGTGHAFFNDDRPAVYHPEAADLAWNRTLAFFREHLP
jgi:carboxymethylenebutenolidase